MLSELNYVAQYTQTHTERILPVSCTGGKKIDESLQREALSPTYQLLLWVFQSLIADLNFTP